MIAIVPAEEIARFYGLKRDQKGFFGRCPFHGGDNPRGLTVLDRHPRPIITCHTARCDWQHDILPALRADGLATVERDSDSHRLWRPERPAPQRTPAPVFRPIGHTATPTQAEALAIWAQSRVIHSELYQHPYYTAKGIPCCDYGARWIEWRGQSTIVVPQYSLPGWAVCGVQLITGNRTDKGGWEKLNRGPRGIGHVGQMAPGCTIAIVEGWADAIALREASPVDHPGVVIAFGKVMPVAENIDLYFNGTRQITAFEDND